MRLLGEGQWACKESETRLLENCECETVGVCWDFWHAQRAGINEEVHFRLAVLFVFGL